MYLSKSQTATARTIISTWMSEGYTFNQACAWVAMALGESSLNPQAVGDNDHSFGLDQIQGPGCDAILAATGINIKTVGVADQCKGVAWEIGPGGPEHAAGAALKKAISPSEACSTLVYLYERPANKLAAVAKRSMYAEDFALMFKDMAS